MAPPGPIYPGPYMMPSMPQPVVLSGAPQLYKIKPEKVKVYTICFFLEYNRFKLVLVRKYLTLSPSYSNYVYITVKTYTIIF